MPDPIHVLVTGANGFVGRHVCEAFSVVGQRLSCLRRTLSESYGDRVGHHAIDLLDTAAVRRLFADLQPDCVVHLAASRHQEAKLEAFRTTYDTNVRTAWNVIQACQGLPNFKRFVFFGSCEEYGRACPPYSETQKADPVSAYGLSKLAITQVLRALYTNHRFPAVVLRPTVIYGPGQGGEMFIPALIQALLAGQPFAMTQGEQTRDFLYVDDVVEAVLKAVHADKNIDGEVINIGSGQHYPVRLLVEIILREISGSRPELVQFGALPYRSHEAMHYAVCIDLAASLLGWRPAMDLLGGLRNTIRHFSQGRHGTD